MDIDIGRVLVQGIELTITGMLVVFVGLTLLYFAVSLFERLKDKPVPTTAPSAPSAAATPKADPVASTAASAAASAEGEAALSPETIAVLTAAAVMMVGKQGRLVRIRYRSSLPSLTWTHQGRATIMAGHQLRIKDTPQR